MTMKIGFILAIFLSSCSLLLGQTTEEEYLYVTYGYKEQLLKGLDDKKGYAWKPLLEYRFTYDNEKLIGHKAVLQLVTFEGLYREKETHPCAIVAIYRKDDGMKKRDGIFICIPHPNSGSDIYAKMETYLREKVELNAVQLRNYALALSKLSITLAQY